MNNTALCTAAFSIMTLFQNAPPESSSISGIVVDIDKRPIAGANVYAIRESSMTAKPIQTTTDTWGHFVLQNVQPGMIYIDASKNSDGYPHSIFSFYILPGEDKPKLNIQAGKSENNVTVQLGQKVAYLDLTVKNSAGVILPATLTMRRPDLPGYFKTSYDGKSGLAVPPVPFELEIEVNGYAPWAFYDPDKLNRINLKSGAHMIMNAQMIELSRSSDR